MNKPHLHAEVIHAWAEGAEIQFQLTDGSEWHSIVEPSWSERHGYRIKPQLKPDLVISLMVKPLAGFPGCIKGAQENPNMRMIFDGETNELKAVELVK